MHPTFISTPSLCVCARMRVRACVCVSSALISVMSFAVVSLGADESAVHLPLPPGLILFV